MLSLISKSLQPKVSFSACKFTSSLAAVENPSTFCVKDEKSSVSFDPFRFFNDRANRIQFTLKNTKVMHAHLLKTAQLQSDIFVANSLLDWYVKSGSIVDAVKLFDAICQPNVISWNTMISGYNSNYLFDDSCRCFNSMRLRDFEPDEITYGSVLSACSALQAPIFGKQVYALAVKNGFFSNGYVCAGMIHLFAKNYSFEDSIRVFYDIPMKNVVCWNATISGAVKNGKHLVALDLFSQMIRESLVPNSFSFSSVLTACSALEELDTGKAVQGWAVKCGAGDVFVGTAIVDLYAKCGEMDEAVKEFSRMPSQNVVSWTTVISGFVQKDDYLSALKFFIEMRNMKVETNNYTATSIISACARPDMFEEGIQIHSWILKSGFYTDSVIQAALINMYSKVGVISLAEMVYKEIENTRIPNSWAVLISCFAQNHSSQRALELLQTMLQEGLKPDRFCTSSVFSVIECIKLGRQMHCYALKTGLVVYLSVGSSLFTMYSKCGSLEDSLKVFENIPVRDNISWASMIAGFAEHGCADKALQLFRQMLSEETKPDQMTLTAIISACASLLSLSKGKEIHGYAVRAGLGNEALLGGGLINLYSKCSALRLARRVFDMLPQKDHVSCSSLISGYAQSGLIQEALLLFHEMLMSDLAVNSFTLSSIIGAIASPNGSGIGNQLHALVIKLGLNSDVSVGSSVVTMYSKCGSVKECQKAFDEIDNPDLIGWTAMISSYAEHGKGVEALRIYELMRKEGIKPDSVTFVGVLSSCSRNGLVEEGYYHLNSMTKEYGIKPDHVHYACMIDTLGRSGRLKEAESLINEMPIEPHALVWGTLLSSCKLHGNVELGRLAAKKVIELEPCDAGAYVSLSNICADMGQWEEVIEIRSLMRGTGLKKEPGWSTV